MSAVRSIATINHRLQITPWLSLICGRLPQRPADHTKSKLQQEPGGPLDDNKGLVVASLRGLEAAKENHKHITHRNLETQYVVSQQKPFTKGSTSLSSVPDAAGNAAVKMPALAVLRCASTEGQRTV